ncbi:MAG: hypothetical protein GXP30_01080 [Verrucomicrobia bacterium]|nr:hypothetical protein [Verrucomicrobiota bacterium]
MRENSGGNRLIREFEFIRPLKLSLLTQHRIEAPYGLNGGQPGECGKQSRTRADGSCEELPPSVEIQTQAGDRLTVSPSHRLTVETPGGGGWGTIPD